MKPSAPPFLRPFPRPDWRWELSTAPEDGFFRPCPDTAVRAARRFWRSWTDVRSGADRRILAERMPLLYQAFAIYRDPRGVTRHGLEARVLAAEAPEAIGRKLGIRPKVVTAYEALYFDVRDRLGHPDFILHEVIGPRLRTARTWTYDLSWKFFGFVGGVPVLDELMDTGRAAAPPRTIQEAAAFLSADARAVLARKLAAAARALPEDARIATVLLQAEAKAKKEGDEEWSRDPLLRGIEAMIREIPWVCGTAAEEAVPAKLAEYDRLAVELRAEEVMRLGGGEETPEMQALRAQELPPPRPKTAVLTGLDEAEGRGGLQGK